MEDSLRVLASRLPAGSSHATWTCAAVAAAGGAAGYARARSLRSLAAGAVFGLSYGAAALFIGRGEAERGFRYGALTSAALAVAMAARLARGARARGPAGALAAVNVAAGAWHAAQWARVRAEAAEGEADDGGARGQLN